MKKNISKVIRVILAVSSLAALCACEKKENSEKNPYGKIDSIVVRYWNVAIDTPITFRIKEKNGEKIDYIEFTANQSESYHLEERLSRHFAKNGFPKPNGVVKTKQSSDEMNEKKYHSYIFYLDKQYIDSQFRKLGGEIGFTCGEFIMEKAFEMNTKEVMIDEYSIRKLIENSKLSIEAKNAYRRISIKIEKQEKIKQILCM